MVLSLSSSDMPGWSTYLNKDCGGNDLTSFDLDTPYNCIKACIDLPQCVAVTVNQFGLCFLKNRCHDLTDLQGYHTYRILGKHSRILHLIGLKGCHTYMILIEY